MVRCLSWVLLGLLVVTAASAPAWAIVFPYTEDFSTNDANWKKADSAAPTYVANGGPLGAGDAYISSLHTFIDDDLAQTIFRGQNGFDSSSDAFVGGWLAAGVNEYSFWLRHNASISLTVAARFANSANGQGRNITSDPVVWAPNVWQKFTVSIVPSNPGWIPEGPVNFFTLFNNLGNLQILAENETLAEGTQVRFDLDKVSIQHVPEPTSAVLAALAALSLGLVYRSRGRKNRSRHGC